MHHAALLITTAALITLTACGDKTETAEATRKAEVSIDIDDSEGAPSGKVQLKLPGGIEAKINLPDGIGDESKVDIAGVGLYPGAKLRGIDIDAAKARSERSATVKISFAAPADAAVVADWYQRQFDAKGVAVTRSGETLVGKTEKDKPFTLALEPAGTGASKGLLTITDSKQR